MATTASATYTLPTTTLPTSIFSLWVARGLNDLHGAEPTEPPTKTTKKRGRPVGSKNKAKVEPTKTQASKRGRRPGSKNRHASKTKKNVAAATLIQQYWRTQMSGR